MRRPKCNRLPSSRTMRMRAPSSRILAAAADRINPRRLRPLPQKQTDETSGGFRAAVNKRRTGDVVVAGSCSASVAASAEPGSVVAPAAGSGVGGGRHRTSATCLRASLCSCTGSLVRPIGRRSTSACPLSWVLASNFVLATTPLRRIGIADLFRKTRTFRNNGNVGFNYKNFLAMRFRGLILRELAAAANSLPRWDLWACAT